MIVVVVWLPAAQGWPEPCRSKLLSRHIMNDSMWSLCGAVTGLAVSLQLGSAMFLPSCCKYYAL